MSQAKTDRTCVPFTAAAARRALRVYEASVRSRGWRIAQKVELYAAGAVAWDAQRPQAERCEAFGRIYAELRGYWQVFRNAKNHWSVERAFDELDSIGKGKSDRAAGLSEVMGDTRLREEVVEVVRRVLPIKTNPGGGHSAMAVSKFLHFRQPRLFPIYDRAVIELEVIRALRPAWKAIALCDEFAGTSDPQARVYLRYVQWLAALMQPHRDEVMKAFAAWFGRHASAGTPDGLGGSYACYEATAAEMILIGRVRGG